MAKKKICFVCLIVNCQQGHFVFTYVVQHYSSVFCLYFVYKIHVMQKVEPQFLIYCNMQNRKRNPIEVLQEKGKFRKNYKILHNSKTTKDIQNWFSPLSNMTYLLSFFVHYKHHMTILHSAAIEKWCSHVECY